MAGMNQHQIALLLCFYSNVQNVNAPKDAQRVTPLSCRKGARLIKSVVASTKVFGKKIAADFRFDGGWKTITLGYTNLVLHLSSLGLKLCPKKGKIVSKTWIHD